MSKMLWYELINVEVSSKKEADSIQISDKVKNPDNIFYFC